MIPSKNVKRIVGIVILIVLVGLGYYFMPTSISKSQWNQLVSTAEKTDVGSEKYAVLIDYSRPVFERRLWLVELRTKKVLLNCHVSHAKNSGYFWATSYSNTSGSELSCFGRFITLQPYESQYGKGIYKVGLRIKGIDSNNNKAFKRNIVFHSSFPFWSKGCFMTSQQNNKLIIETVEEGSLVLVLP